MTSSMKERFFISEDVLVEWDCEILGRLWSPPNVDCKVYSV